MSLIGARLRDLRQNRSLTLKQVAGDTGFALSFLSLVDRVKVSTSVDELSRLARYYGVRSEHFFQGADESASLVARHRESLSLSEEEPMETFPLALALIDFIPPLAFLVGAFYLVKISFICRGTRCARMVMAGTLLVFLAGFLKATWKLFYTIGTADIQWMSQGQFVFSAIGFLAMAVAVILMARGRGQDTPGPVVLSMAMWKIPFLFVMTVTSLAAEGILAYIAFRRQAWWAAAGFVVGVLGLLAMGALASGEQTVAMQWVEEVINAIGQLGFMLGSILLYRDFKRTPGECCDGL
jgi:transcriptional regulator with XRE-family HTH domain